MSETRRENVQNENNFGKDPVRKAPEEVKTTPKEIQTELENIEMPEELSEPQGKSSQWDKFIENKELGISYREKVIELPQHRKKETGVKRIRRRELLKPLPDGLYTPAEKNELRYNISGGEKINLPYYSGEKKFDSIYKFLTDDRYPSYGSFVHAVEIGFLYRSSSYRTQQRVERLKSENIYLQEIFPKNIDDVSIEALLCLYEKKGDNLEIQKSITGEIPKKQIGVFTLFSHQNRMWADDYSTPIFIFSNRNRAFNDYINAVLSNSETKEMLKSQDYNWGVERKDEKFELISPNSPQYIEYLSRLSELQNLEEYRKNNVLVPKGNFDAVNRLKVIKEGIPILGGLNIPIIRHPNIRPLRWCHAELALIPTKRSLNVLFFETEDKDKKEK